MAIIFENNIFHLNTANSEYQIAIDEIGLVIHNYYGQPVANQDMGYQILSIDRGFSGNLNENRYDRGRSIDVLPQEYSGCGVGDYRVHSIEVTSENGSRSCDLRYHRHVIVDGKSKIPGLPSVRVYEDSDEDTVQTLIIYTYDPVIGLGVELYYSVFEEKDIITRHVQMRNIGTQCLQIEKASSAMLDIPYSHWDEIHFAGRHCMERQVTRNHLTQEIRVIGSTRGMSSHHENPFVIICDRNASEDYGDCYGMMLMYSGNHKFEIELDQTGSTRIVAGIHNEQFSWLLEPGCTFETPEVIMAYTSKGLSQLSHLYHDIIRRNVCHRKYWDKKRSVLINNWEATYFHFDSEKIIEIAKQASEVGIDMLVLDDGWFGKRDDDNSGLGDWTVNEKKLPGGLKYIADELEKMGMKFGLWFEPEMVNEDSDLYRMHPDWVLTDPNRPPTMARNQLVLDMSNPDVVDYLYDSICKVLESAHISYIKWDFNRSLANVYSHHTPANRQGEVPHRFMLGTYKLLQRLLDAYPDIMIEGCSGGGGRFDAGMLYYCPQIWCSDDTDAIERLEIQEGTSFGYPVCTMGSHVSAVPNHQTGRVTSLDTRGVVAMSGTFGYELDITKLSGEEKAKIRDQIGTFHQMDTLITNGDYYRLTEVDENEFYKAWEIVSKDKREFLLCIVVKKEQANGKVKHVKLKGLDAGASYRFEEGIYTGAALMYGGCCVNLVSGAYMERGIKL